MNKIFHLLFVLPLPVTLFVYTALYTLSILTFSVFFLQSFMLPKALKLFCKVSQVTE